MRVARVENNGPVETRRGKQGVLKALESVALIIGIAVLIGIFGFLRPEAFLSWTNISTMLGSQAVLVILTLALITNLFTLRIRKLPVGRAWEALREDEIACRSLGINARNTKLTAFSIGAMFAGFAGSAGRTGPAHRRRHHLQQHRQEGAVSGYPMDPRLGRGRWLGRGW